MSYPIHTLLSRTAHRMRNDLRPCRDAVGLSPGQPKVLRSLIMAGPCSQRRLAWLCEVDPSAVCRMLDNMERDGLLVRSPSPTDRRAGEIRVTDKGQEVFRQWEAQCALLEEQMLKGFTEEERIQFSILLSRAYENLGGHLLSGRDGLCEI